MKRHEARCGSKAEVEKHTALIHSDLRSRRAPRAALAHVYELKTPTTEAAGSSLAVRQFEDFLLVGDCFLRTWRLVKQVEVEFVIVGHASHRLIRVFKTLGIGGDPDSRKAETRQLLERKPGLTNEICDDSNPEEEC